MTANEVFDEGYDAYWDGVAAEDNPYDEGTDDRRTWNDGWLKAKQHDLDESDG